MQEKKLFTILNTIADWIIRVIMINLLVITFMLPVVTIIPAITAGYKLFSDYLNKDEENLFKGFFKYFKEAFVNKMIVTIILILVIGVTYYNNRQYGTLIESNSNILYTIGYYLTLVILIGVIMITMYLPLVFSERSKYDIGKSFKLAFYLSGKYVFRTVALTLTLLIPYLMFTTNFTILLFVFCGVSIVLLLNALITKKPRKYLQEMEGKL
ncbi:MAG TPA: YesL family protein [Acholeplasmataceae bacterium]|nr:YesL family protein [Acholeplasmataceae bacterium]